MQTLPACDLPGQSQNFDFGWEQNVCSNKYSSLQNISSVSLILSYTSNMRANSMLSYLPRSQGELWACLSWNPNLRPVNGALASSETWSFSSECVSYPPALPLVNLWPHQSPESRGDLIVSPGLTWYPLLSLQRARNIISERWRLCVCVTGAVTAHSPSFTGTFQHPKGQEEQKLFVQPMQPWKQQLCVV